MHISTIKVIAVWLILSLCGAMAHAGAVAYVYTDAQGTPLAKADANGNIIATFDYAPYGSQALGTPTNGPGYAGHVNDPDTGFTYMQARYYDPEVGRFVSVDPIQPKDKDVFSFNRYTYANNNPYRFTDPNGREVVGIYSNDNNSLFMVDKETRAWAFVEAESGGKPFGGPTPAGVYSVLERAGRAGFYRLERQDADFGDDRTPDGRTNLRLHGPGRTIGCISVCTQSGFLEIERILKQTSTSTVQVNDKSLRGRLGGRKETLKNFGTMHVLSVGSSLRFDSSTGKVSIRWTETGSLIPKEKLVCTVKDGACK